MGCKRYKNCATWGGEIKELPSVQKLLTHTVALIDKSMNRWTAERMKTEHTCCNDSFEVVTDNMVHTVWSVQRGGALEERAKDSEGTFLETLDHLRASKLYTVKIRLLHHVVHTVWNLKSLFALAISLWNHVNGHRKQSYKETVHIRRWHIKLAIHVVKRTDRRGLSCAVKDEYGDLGRRWKEY